MASFWEPEEFVGGIWHRLVGDTSSYPRHPQAAVRLEEMRIRLGVLFRALGGPGAVRLAGGAAEASGHRLGLIQRLGLGTEKLEGARYDGVTLQLPDHIDLFPDRADNAALYEWLAAFFVHAEARPVISPPKPPPPMPSAPPSLRCRRITPTRASAISRWMINRMVVMRRSLSALWSLPCARVALSRSCLSSRCRAMIYAASAR